MTTSSYDIETAVALEERDGILIEEALVPPSTEASHLLDERLALWKGCFFFKGATYGMLSQWMLQLLVEHTWPNTNMVSIEDGMIELAMFWILATATFIAVSAKMTRLPHLGNKYLDDDLSLVLRSIHVFGAAVGISLAWFLFEFYNHSERTLFQSPLLVLVILCSGATILLGFDPKDSSRALSRRVNAWGIFVGFSIQWSLAALSNDDQHRATAVMPSHTVFFPSNVSAWTVWIVGATFWLAGLWGVRWTAANVARWGDENSNRFDAAFCHGALAGLGVGMVGVELVVGQTDGILVASLVPVTSVALYRFILPCFSRRED